MATNDVFEATSSLTSAILFYRTQGSSFEQLPSARQSMSWDGAYRNNSDTIAC